MGVHQILVLPPRLDEVFRDVRVTEDFHLFIKQTVLHLKGQAERPGHFLKLLIEGKLLLKVFVLLLTGPLGLAESLFMLRFGLGHELRVVCRIGLFEQFDITKKILIFFVYLGDGCGCGIGIGQDIFQDVVVKFFFESRPEFDNFGIRCTKKFFQLLDFFVDLPLLELSIRHLEAVQLGFNGMQG